MWGVPYIQHHCGLVLAFAADLPCIWRWNVPLFRTWYTYHMYDSSSDSWQKSIPFRSTLSHYSGGPLQQPISVGTALILQTWNALILCMDCYWKKKKKKQDDVPRPRWGRTLGPWYVSLRINHWHKELWQLLEGWINFVMFDIHGPCCVMSLFSLFRFKLLNWTVAPSYRAHKPNAIKKIHTTGALGTCHLIQLNITHSPPCN